jgi:RNA polymerase sigma-70 factor (ECF subfamily)
MNTQEYNASVDQFSDGIYRFILKNLKDSERAKDVVQEAYVRLWGKVEEVDGDKARQYLYTTAYRIMIDMIRRDKKQGDYDEDQAEQATYDRGYSDLNEILHQALETLPPQQKSVVLLRDYEGYSYAEIGTIMNLTEAQVKVYIFRARKALRTYIGSIEQVL